MASKTFIIENALSSNVKLNLCIPPHSVKLYVEMNAGIPQSISYIMNLDEKLCVSHQVMCKTHVFCFIFRAHGFKSIKTSMTLIPSLFKSLEYILDPPNLIQSFWKKPVQGLTKIKVTLVLPLSCIRNVWEIECLQNLLNTS